MTRRRRAQLQQRAQLDVLYPVTHACRQNVRGREGNARPQGLVGDAEQRSVDGRCERRTEQVRPIYADDAEDERGIGRRRRGRCWGATGPVGTEDVCPVTHDGGLLGGREGVEVERKEATGDERDARRRVAPLDRKVMQRRVRLRERGRVHARQGGEIGTARHELIYNRGDEQQTQGIICLYESAKELNYCNSI